MFGNGAGLGFTAGESREGLLPRITAGVGAAIVAIGLNMRLLASASDSQFKLCLNVADGRRSQMMI